MADGVQLRAGDEEIYFVRSDSVDVVVETLGLLDGTRRRQDVLTAVGRQHAELLENILEQLATHRLLREGGSGNDDEVSRYLSHFLEPDHSAASNVEDKSAAVLGHAASVALMTENLESHGLGVHAVPRSDEGLHALPADVDVAVSLSERADLAWTEAVNRLACERGTPCLFIDISHGRHATVGPFYIPGEGACYACLRDRLRQNTRAYEEHVAAEEWMRTHGRELPGYGLLPTFRYQAVGVGGSEIIAFLTRYRPLRTLNRQVTIDFEHLTSWSEPVWRIPWCSVCATE